MFVSAVTLPAPETAVGGRQGMTEERIPRRVRARARGHLVSASGSSVAVNRCGRELVGYAAGELKGKPTHGLVRAADEAALAEEQAEMEASGWGGATRVGAVVEKDS